LPLFPFEPFHRYPFAFYPIVHAKRAFNLWRGGSVERQFYSDVYVRLKELYFQSVTINTHARRQRNCKVHPCFFVPSFLGLPPISAIKPPRPKILVLRAEFLTLDFPLLEFSGFFPSRLEPLQISSTYYYLPVIQPVFF